VSTEQTDKLFIYLPPSRPHLRPAIRFRHRWEHIFFLRTEPAHAEALVDWLNRMTFDLSDEKLICDECGTRRG
jgi:hypothetical protein